MNYRLDSRSLHDEIPPELFRIIESAVNAVDPEQLILRNAHKDENILRIGSGAAIDLAEVNRLHVIGTGKAAPGMARGINRVLDGCIHGGVVIAKHVEDGATAIGAVRVIKGNHPVPGPESVSSSRQLIEYARRQIGADDLVLCLITGGGSALMACPVDGVSLEDLQETTGLLLGCGATINEMNTIRKHLEVLKGGGLARLVYPARVVTLILSDVIGNPLEIIASGPTCADSSTFRDAWDILARRGVQESIPGPVRAYLQDGLAGKNPETVKPDSQILERVEQIILGDNRYACEAAMQTASDLGFQTHLLTNSLKGEARDAGIMLAKVLRTHAESGKPAGRPFCILAGGETTVHIRGKGLGGRNQEMALAAVKELAGVENVAFIPFATDGEDGPTNAAGAVVTGHTFRAALEAGLDPQTWLDNNDSWVFFQRLGASLVTGPTGTNVNDICFMFAW
jgi:glycerate 2-kinase